VPAGDSEKYLLSDDGEDEEDEDEDEKLDTVEESQAVPAPVGDGPDDNADAERGSSPEELEDGGSIPEDSAPPSVDPQPQAQGEAEAPPLGEPEHVSEGSTQQQEPESIPVVEEVKEEQSSSDRFSTEEGIDEEPVVEAPVAEPASNSPAPGRCSLLYKRWKADLGLLPGFNITRLSPLSITDMV
jgi:hypothetical protein